MCVRKAKRGLWIVLLWIIFTIGCFIAPFLALGFHFAHRCMYIKNLVKAADRMTAALLGFSGRFLVSTELAASNRYQWMYKALNEIAPHHCEASAYDEAAYCRIKDKSLGDR